MSIYKFHYAILLKFFSFTFVSTSLKILVVRFSSIGDIVLTSPVLRILKSQKNIEVHFLTKDEYTSILEKNPYIEKIHVIKNSVAEVKDQLFKEKFDYIIDLHNNLRSQLLRSLKVPIKRYSKSNFKKFLYMFFGINLLNNKHVVDRYVDVLSFLNLKNDDKGLDYFLPKGSLVDYDVKQKYITWCIGASKIQKQLSVSQIATIANKLDLPIILLGGKEQKEHGDKIIQISNKARILNFCGEVSINQSAYLIKNSQYLFTNDTGLMHIAAAFQKKIISFWGCTKPDLGFYPYIEESKSLMIVSKNSKRQCSKHGGSCKFSDDGCVKMIDAEKILKRIKEFIS
tara:strand:+ start:796 stop:1821 length:1026 start_codon:yes stop_codon:yes gene_type:complete